MAYQARGFRRGNRRGGRNHDDRGGRNHDDRGDGGGGGHRVPEHRAPRGPDGGGRGFDRGARGHRGNNPPARDQRGQRNEQNNGELAAAGAHADINPAVAEGQARPREYRFGLQILNQLLERDPNDLVSHISTRFSGFPQALLDPILLQKRDCITAMLAVIAKALTCDANMAARILLLNMIRTSPFLQSQMPTYLTQMMTVNGIGPRQRALSQSLKDLLSLLHELLTRMPSSFHGVYHIVMVTGNVIRMLQTSTTVVDADIEQAFDDVEKICKELLTQAQNEAKGAAVTNTPTGVENQMDVNPPNNFREMNIFPDVEIDLQNRKQFIRENIVRGAYEDAEHYLDVQFRLLREDFVQPLRNGIKDYQKLYADEEVGVDGRRGGRPGGRRVKLADVRIYHDVSVLNPICTQSGIQYRIRFDALRMTNVNWAYTKRLIYGSLLCLTKDDFRTIFLATVAERKPELLKDGFLTVKFEVNPEGVRRISPDEKFLMVETSAYFEAYRHVLKALQDTREADIPFRSIILKCSKEVNFPRYLLGAAEPVYNLLPLARDAMDSYNEEEERSPEQRRMNTILRSVEILHPRKWPSAETLHLDLSQLRAIQAALTREVSIIQGPPGSGKTYIGLKVVQALIENKPVWNQHAGGENSPILIVCYTNHALDQFLEGIAKFVKNDIIRVGGRSKSELMKSFLLSNVRRLVRENRNVPRAIFHQRKDIRDEMERERLKIEEMAAVIESTEKGLVHEAVLEDFISLEHFADLLERGGMANENQQSMFETRQSSRYGPSRLPVWLGLYDFIREQEAPMEVDNANEVGEPMEVDGAAPAQPPEEMDLIEVEDEGQAIADLRRLELDGDPNAERRHRDEMRRVRNERNANDQLAVNFEDLLERLEEVQPVGAPQDDNAWRTQGANRRKRKQRLRQGLLRTAAMTEEEARAVQDIWELTVNNRWKLYHYWIGCYKKSLKRDVQECEANYQISADRFLEISEQEDQAIMQNAAVVGMTTTGAARYKNALKQIRPKIIVVEEAAEVLEAHIVTTLSSGCEHLILIGDHKQLRPGTNVHKLAEDYNLKISLFERLAMNELPIEVLSRQHRMRPEIADVMRVIYPELTDDDSVQARENIRGIMSNLFFIHHTADEYKDEELKSHSNEHEAKFVVALCRYLILQGYKPAQITILTPYTGQMFLLRRLMPRAWFDGVRVCPIDNYQGEENDIILLSLVRSNSANGKIGFVKDENRTCVAMSRAKMGLYAIGNFQQIARHSQVWSKMIQVAMQKGFYGPGLPLCCQNHPDAARRMARSKEDFDQAPEGGCMRECGYRLDCGHVCERVCHTYDRKHEKFKCNKICNKELCGNKHLCRRLCGVACGSCKQLVDRVLRRCGHRQRVPCSDPVDEFRCQDKCNYTLQCGHFCHNKCGEDHTTKCKIPVQKTGPCGHKFLVQCYQRTEEQLCTEPCGKLLSCDHPCVGTCGECVNGRIHKACQSKCDRTLVCGHPCREPCTKNCPPCQRQCQNRCVHSRCRRPCGQPCAPCREPCQWQCLHHRCTQLCYQPCDRPRCSLPCQKQLNCGHPCIGLCGEVCPRKCRICNREEVTEIFFGDEDEEDARFVRLEDCGHNFTVEGLDQWMDSKPDQEEHGAQEITIQMKTCPKCKTPIRRNLRYNILINSTLGDIERVKEKILGDLGENRRKQDVLRKELRPFLAGSHRPAQSALQNYDDLLRDESLSADMINCVENIVKFVKRMEEWKEKVDKACRSCSATDAETKRYLLQLQSDSKQVVDWLHRVIADGRCCISEQELRECAMEIGRYDLLLLFSEIQGKLKSGSHPRLTQNIRQRFERIFGVLKSGKPLTSETKREADESIMETGKAMSGLGISDEERKEILRAMEPDLGHGDSAKGHWFKCPNGHIYCIADCGGATVESRCGECNARIGGGSHALRTDNRFAPEMDNATRPAWPGMAMNPVE